LPISCNLFCGILNCDHRCCVQGQTLVWSCCKIKKYLLIKKSLVLHHSSKHGQNFMCFRYIVTCNVPLFQVFLFQLLIWTGAATRASNDLVVVCNIIIRETGGTMST
jgi:hypothetical protein